MLPGTPGKMTHTKEREKKKKLDWRFEHTTGQCKVKVSFHLKLIKHPSE